MRLLFLAGSHEFFRVSLISLVFSNVARKPLTEEKELTVEELKADIALLKERIDEVTSDNERLADMIQQLEEENRWLKIAVEELLEETQVLTEVP